MPVISTRLLCAAVLGVAYGCSPAPVPVDLLVENVTIYSGSDSRSIVASVAIRDGKFVEISPPGEGQFVADETIDGSGKFMTPGLWDAHTHVRSSKERGLNIENFIESGVTSVHDVGGYVDRLKLLETEIKAGSDPSPSIYPSYFMLNGESFADFQRVVTTESEVNAAIDELVSLGAVQVKVHRALAPEMLPFVVQHAHKRNLTVTGHIPLGVHPLEACEIGMDGIEHVGSIVEAVISTMPESDNKSQADIDYLMSESAQSIYSCLSARNVVVTPTLVIYPAIAKRRAAGNEIPQEFVEFIESMKQITHRLYATGVSLLTGTDTTDLADPISLEPGASLIDEMVLLEEAGVPATEIIAMASLNAARSIGLDGKAGSIDSGKDADFLLLAADPGDTVQNFRSIVSVYQMGRLVFSEAK
jgi:imidazolonepropionase-like amidohydrolase